jgi:hypothetical protein
VISALPLEAGPEGIESRELNNRESVKAVFEHRPNENTLDSTNVKGKL